MKAYPSLPSVTAEPERLPGGHLWIQEWIDGAHLRFQLQESGLLRFGDRRRTFGLEDVPLPYRHAVRHVRERLDRDALRAAAAGDVDSVVFFAEATHRHAVDYDWDRLPSVLVFDVWSGSRDRFLPPDVVDRAVSELGLEPVNTFAREVRAADFHPARYEFPTSAWYDGPPAGAVLCNKTGDRVRLARPGFLADPPAPEPFEASPGDLAERFVTRQLVERAAAAAGDDPGFDAVLERVVDRLVREHHARLFHDRSDLTVRAFRSAIAARVRQRLAALDGL